MDSSQPYTCMVFTSAGAPTLSGAELAARTAQAEAGEFHERTSMLANLDECAPIRRSRERTTKCVLSLAWAVPVTLLAAVVGMLAMLLAQASAWPRSERLVDAPPARLGDQMASGTTAAEAVATAFRAANWSEDVGAGGDADEKNASVAAKEARATAIADALRALQAEAPYEARSRLNNASDRFVSAWVNISQGKVWLEVDERSLGEAEYIVSAMASRADGTVHSLHEPLSDDSATNTYMFLLAPNGRDVDLVRPQQRLRKRGDGTVDGSLYQDGTWAGWERSFEATHVTVWRLGSNATTNADAIALANETDARCPVAAPELLHLKGDVPPARRVTSVSARAALDACMYSRVSASRMFDATAWVVSGELMGEGAPMLRNARLASARGFAHNLEVQVQAHVAAEEEEGSSASTAAVELVSLQLHYSIAELPPLDDAFVARIADDRVGFWQLAYTELGTSATASTLSGRQTDRQVRVIQRWRLDKAEPHKQLSAPVKPITYHIDPSVPERWWAAVKRGVENWNAAFATAGFDGAVRAVLPTDADWPEDYSAGDMRFSTISFAVSTESVYAIGPHIFDPRTGQILSADIMFADGWVDYWLESFEREGPGRSTHVHTLRHAHAGLATGEAGGGGSGSGARLGPAPTSSRLSSQLQRAQRRVHALLGEEPSPGARGAKAGGGLRPGQCGRSLRGALEEAIGASALLGEDGGVVPVAFVEQAMTEVVMHEVGHTLGLRHNFKGSTAYTLEQISDPAFAAAHGTGSSVMDYSPILWPSVDADHAARAVHFSPVVGAYDKWAIEYGYTAIDGERSGVQHPTLAALAARAGDSPELAFATDEDMPTTAGVDPLTNMFDLSSDPVGYYEQQLALAHMLLASAANRSVLAGESWTRQYAVVQGFMSKALRAGAFAAKYVGGYIFSKAHRGDPHAPPPAQPVPLPAQERALRLSLRVLSQDFWLPAAAASKRLVTRKGECDGLNQICLGLGTVDVLAAAMHTRKLVLLQLIQPQRISGLAQHEWLNEDTPESNTAAAGADGGGGGGGGGSGGGGHGGAQPTALVADWLPPLAASLEDALHQALAGGPSISALLLALHSVLTPPFYISEPAPLSLGEGESLVATKMGLELHRAWVVALASFGADGVDEGAAISSRLLRELQQQLVLVAAHMDDMLRYSPLAVRRVHEDHLASLDQLLGLWVRGVELPQLLPEDEND